MSDTLAAPAPGKEPSKIKRNIVLGMIIVLLLMLVFLIYYYLTMLKPKTASNLSKLEVGNFRYVRSIYGISEKDLFGSPADIAVDSSQNIYVADSSKSRILVFDRNGNYIKKIGKSGKKKGELHRPKGVDVDADGNIYVTDTLSHKVLIYNSDGAFKKEWLVMWPNIPKVIDNKLYVSTYGPLYVYDKDGKELKKIGKVGKEFKNFNMSYGLAGHAKKVYVADLLNARVAVLNEDSEVKWALGAPYKSMNDINTRFQAPVGIDVDEYGLVYVLDGIDASIEILKGQKSVQKFGEQGTQDGSLSRPIGLAYAGNNRIIISEQEPKRVQIWDIANNKALSEARKDLRPTNLSVVKKDSFFESLFWSVKALLGL